MADFDKEIIRDIHQELAQETAKLIDLDALDDGQLWIIAENIKQMAVCIQDEIKS